MNTQPYPYPVQLLQLETRRREAPEWLEERETRVRASRRRRGLLRRRNSA